MTKAQVDELKIKVAVIQNDIGTLKNDTKSVKNLLKWFVVLSVMIMGVVTTNIIMNTGDKKVMKSIVEHNSKVVGDMAAQGIKNGWYEPTEETYRNGTTN